VGWGGVGGKSSTDQSPTWQQPNTRTPCHRPGRNKYHVLAFDCWSVLCRVSNRLVSVRALPSGSAPMHLFVFRVAPRMCSSLTQLLARAFLNMTRRTCVPCTHRKKKSPFPFTQGDQSSTARRSRTSESVMWYSLKTPCFEPLGSAK